MAQDNMVLFASKIQLESKWNELFLKNGGLVTPEMSVLGDNIKKSYQTNPSKTRES